MPEVGRLITLSFQIALSLSTYAPVKQFLRVDKDKVIYSHPVSHRFIFSELEHTLGPEQ